MDEPPTIRELKGPVAPSDSSPEASEVNEPLTDEEAFEASPSSEASATGAPDFSFLSDPGPQAGAGE